MVGPMESHTWDGLSISPVPPFGAAIIVYRVATSGTVEFLVPHRRAVPDDDANWSWGPPSGCRWPGEEITVTARRELLEETGLDRCPIPVTSPDVEWSTFTIRVEPDQPIVLSDEHDRLVWLPTAVALERVSPDTVRDQLRAVIASLAVV